MHLKENVLELVKKDTNLRNRLAYELKVNGGTVTRWLYETPHNVMLTTAHALSIIANELKIPQSKLLDKKKVA